MVGEVLRFLTVKTAVHHDIHKIRDIAADGHLGMTALSRVTLASAGLSCIICPMLHAIAIGQITISVLQCSTDGSCIHTLHTITMAANLTTHVADLLV